MSAVFFVVLFLFSFVTYVKVLQCNTFVAHYGPAEVWFLVHALSFTVHNTSGNVMQYTQH